MLNKFLKTSRFTILASSLVVLGACNKLYEPVPYTEYSAGDVANTVYKKLAANTNYSVFTTALVRTGISAELDVANAKFTVFAPDNTALAAAGINATTVAAIPLADLTAVINYHVIPAEGIVAAQIPDAFPNAEKKSKLNITTTAFVPSIPTTSIPIKMSIFPSRRGTAAWANNIPVAAADIMTGSNGVVHRVGAVVAPPSRVLLDTISRDAEFSYLVAAIVRADSGLATNASPSLQYALAQPFANLTVFAPTNAAFSALPAGTVDNLLKPENKADLTAVLTYHVVSGTLKAADLKDGQKLKTVNGAELTVSIKDGKVMIDGANVTAADLTAGNGVVHVLDAVVLPKK